MLLQYFYIKFFPCNAIYFVKCTTLFGSSKTPPQYVAATLALHSWDGVPRLVIFPFFPPNITMFIMIKWFTFSSIRPQDKSSKSKVRSLCVFANCSLTVECCFWKNGFFLAELASVHVGTGLGLSVDDTLWPASVSIFTRSLAFVVGVMRTFHSKTRSSRECRAVCWQVWWQDTRLVFILVFNCLNRWAWHIQASGNSILGLIRSVKIDRSLLLWFILIFSWWHMRRKKQSLLQLTQML